jgi:hypothetical protein
MYKFKISKFDRLLKNKFSVILNEVKDLSSVWNYKILRCVQNDLLSSYMCFSTAC